MRRICFPQWLLLEAQRSHTLRLIGERVKGDHRHPVAFRSRFAWRPHCLLKKRVLAAVQKGGSLAEVAGERACTLVGPRASVHVGRALVETWQSLRRKHLRRWNTSFHSFAFGAIPSPLSSPFLRSEPTWAHLHGFSVVGTIIWTVLCGLMWND